MRRFILLAGVPGSGKSSFRHNLLVSRPDTVVLSPDDWLENKAQELGISYQDIWLPEHADHIRESRRVMYERLHEALDEGRDVLWDQTNITFSMRAERLELAGDDCEKICVCFETDRDTILARNDARKANGRHVPDDRLEQMMLDWERPHHDEGFDQIVLVTNNSQTTVL